MPEETREGEERNGLVVVVLFLFPSFVMGPLLSKGEEREERWGEREREDDGSWKRRTRRNTKTT